jgi:hypothetical protein
MKQKYLMSFAALALVASTLVSCSKDDVFSPDQQLKNALAEYETAFVKRYGSVGANVNWGFGATRSVDVNSNEWAAKGYNIPKAITSREREVVMAWFASHKNPTSETVDLTNYFVQNVGHGGVTYTSTPDQNGYTHDAVGSDHMDWIFVGPGRYLNEWEGMTEPAPYTWDNGDEHINNFNANSGQIQHILYTGSEYFGFHDSFQDNGNGSKYSTVNRNFVLRFIDVDGEVGCYVGFDYESHGQQGDIDPDGYFNDRVIKLVPGEGSKQYADRVICEDLGDADDSDFNDVVFDIRYADNGAYVKVRHAGGIYPLYVAGHEIHELAGATKKDDGTYDILNSINPDEFFVSGASSAADIEVSVTYISKSGTAAAAPASTFILRANQGQVPQKICVKPSFGICGERQSLGGKYPNFPRYVAGELGNDEWY